MAGAQAMNRHLATCPHVYVCPKCGQTVGIHSPVVVYRPVCTAHTRATGGAQVMAEVVTDVALEVTA